MEFREVSSETRALDAYLRLFSTCFPSAQHYTLDYLRWLYAENPDGTVIGFDAWDGDALAAHYVCIPIEGVLRGAAVPGILSLNTATSPQYQGKGLFTRLADATYARAAELGRAFAVGVANANSTPGFVRRLGFQLVRPLEARIGIGSLFRGEEQYAALASAAEFRRRWTAETLAWRLRNPSRRVRWRREGSRTRFSAATDKPLIAAYWESYGDPAPPAGPRQAGAPGLNLFIGALPLARWSNPRYCSIPARLRPSPLNFIFRDLGHGHAPLSAEGAMLSFLDWDAY